jgi:hypothetical protein
MKFVIAHATPSETERDTFYLIKSSWNDYGFVTTYTLQYNSPFSIITDVGRLKIGELNMSGNQSSPNLPLEFETLNQERFFSIGCDESYYKEISSFADGKGYAVLYALNDFAVNREIFERAKDEFVTINSLFRGCSNSEKQVSKYFNLLCPPINLYTMKRTFGSTGWSEIDSGLIEMQRLLSNNTHHLYYNAIATIGRQIIMNMVDRVYNDEIHRNKNLYPNSPTQDQFINKLHGFIDYEYSTNNISQELKKYIKTSIELVQRYVHQQEVQRYEGVMCVHAVISLVYQICLIYNRQKYNEVTP